MSTINNINLPSLLRSVVLRPHLKIEQLGVVNTINP